MHREMPLPFEGKNVQLSNNRLQAVQPLHGLKKKLQGHLKYCADFTSFRTEIIDKGSARKVNVEQLAPQKKEKSAT